MAIKKIATYETSDGLLFKNPKDAREHEKKRAAHNALLEFARSVYFHGMDAGDLAEALEDRGDEIGIDAYNRFNELPKAVVGSVFLVSCSTLAGCCKFRIVVEDPNDFELRDMLIDMHMAALREKTPDLGIESVILESSTIPTIIGIPKLD